LLWPLLLLKDVVWLMPATARHSYSRELHSCACIVKLIDHYGPTGGRAASAGG